jgi:putative alpha-1,2-mannosidase
MSLCKGFVQGGSNADIVLADAFAKNLTGGIDWGLACEAVVNDAENEPLDWFNKGRGGLMSWKALHYTPALDYQFPEHLENARVFAQ